MGGAKCEDKHIEWVKRGVERRGDAGLHEQSRLVAIAAAQRRCISAPCPRPTTLASPLDPPLPFASPPLVAWHTSVDEDGLAEYGVPLPCALLHPHRLSCVRSSRSASTNHGFATTPASQLPRQQRRRRRPRGVQRGIPWRTTNSP